jgi:hypothetical protein
MTTDLFALLPDSSLDTDKAEALVKLGYPAVEPLLEEILEWQQDMNRPVAQVFQPLLVSIGAPLAPYARVILAGKDDSWKYFLLYFVVRESHELARTLRPELERLASNPTKGELEEELDEIAVEILEAINGGAEA